MPPTPRYRELLVCVLMVLMTSACGAGAGTPVASSDGGQTDENEEMQPDCGALRDGAAEVRVRYATALGSIAKPCTFETQTRSCRDGKVSTWSGTYNQLSCAEAAGPTCSGARDGQIEARVRYRESTADASAVCEAELQQRQCNAGSWSNWSGSYTHDACAGTPDASCGNEAAGTTRVRVRYVAGAVAHGQACVAEAQTQSCQRGAWSDWSGTYAAETCAEQPASSCEGWPDGNVQARIRYAARTVPADATCSYEAQTRACHDGGWSTWSGTYSALSCVVAHEGPDAGSKVELATLSMAPLGTIEIDEDGPGVALTFAANLTPSAAITIALEVSDPHALSIEGSPLTLGAGNISPASVTIKAVRNGRAEGTRYALLRASVISDDPHYDGIQIEPWTVIIRDEGIAGLKVASLSPLETTDDGGEALLEVSLGRKPASNVTVDAISQDATEGVAVPYSLFFTSDNWDVPQSLRIRGVSDAPLVDGDVPYDVRLATRSGDSGYATLPNVVLSLMSHDSPVNDCAQSGWYSCTYGQVCVDKEPGYSCRCPAGTEPSAYGCSQTSVVALGDYHTCERTLDGKLGCWGFNERGESQAPALPGGAAYLTVAAGASHSCALDDQNEIHCFGNSYTPPRAAVGARWMELAAGADFTCALNSLGDITCFGSGYFGTAPIRSEPRRFRSLRGGGTIMCALDDEKMLTCFNTSPNTPVVLPELAAGRTIERFDANGTVCTIDSAGQIACAATAWDEAPPVLRAGVTYRELSVATMHMCAIDSDSMLHCWGTESAKQEGALDVPKLPAGIGFARVDVANGRTCAIDTSNFLHCWGNDSVGQAQVPDAIAGGPWVSLESAAVHTCALDNVGSLRCWGFEALVPPPLKAGVSWTQVRPSSYLGYGHRSATCAVDSEGQGACWGQCPAPPALEAGEGWRELVSGLYFVCGITPDGKMRCAGITPPALPEGTTWLDVDASESSVCGTDSDGSLRCFTAGGQTIAASATSWKTLDLQAGRVSAIDGAGALIVRNTDGSPSYMSVPNLPTGVTWTDFAISPTSGGGNHGCGVDSTGQGHCYRWYYSNDYGEANVPTLEYNVTWRSIRVGEHFSCGLDTRGRRHCWGLRKLSPL